MKSYIKIDSSEMDKEDNKSLYDTQKDTLVKFLERGAITKEQYEKSLNALKEKDGDKNEP